MSQERHGQGSPEAVAQGAVDDEQILHAYRSHIGQPPATVPEEKPATCLPGGLSVLMTAIPASVISDAGCFWKMGVQPALSGIGVGVCSKAFLAAERVSVQSKRVPCAPRPFYEGIWDLKKDACQLFCCLNNRILRLTEPSGALVQKSLHRNPICCQCSPWKKMNKPPTAPPGPVLTSTQEGLRLGALCSLSNPRGRPGALRAGGCPGPGPCGTRRC